MNRLHIATALLNAVLIVIFAFGGYTLLVTGLTGGSAGWLAEHGTFDARLVVGLLLGLSAGSAGMWSWWSLRFWIAGDDLVVETGILRRRARHVPLSRVQAVDVVRPLVTRLVRLAEVRVELAGGDRAEARFRYLGRGHAERLRAELLARAAGTRGYAPEARPYWRVGFGALFGSQVLRLPFVGALVLLTGLLGFGAARGEPGVLGGVVPLLLGLARGVIAPLVRDGRFTATLAPEGVRLRHGLMETRMRTVPPGRVQAVRVVEPLLWRAFGWARLDVTIAGYAGGRQALSSVLLPVAPRAVALRLVGLLFPGTDIEALPMLPPSRPWPMAGGATGSDDTVFVTRRGLLCRRLDVIAYARVQSVRLTAGPLQRLLGRGTVHVDAPPGPVRAAAENRDLAEARAIFECAAARAHRARAADLDQAALYEPTLPDQRHRGRPDQRTRQRIYPDERTELDPDQQTQPDQRTQSPAERTQPEEWTRQEERRQQEQPRHQVEQMHQAAQQDQPDLRDQWDQPDQMTRPDRPPGLSAGV